MELKKEQVNVRLSETLLQSVDKLAEMFGTTRTGTIAFLCDEAIKNAYRVGFNHLFLKTVKEAQACGVDVEETETLQKITDDIIAEHDFDDIVMLGFTRSRG